jgi:nucleolar protein 56
MQLLTTWFGSFLVDEGKVVHQRLFPKDADAIAERLGRIEDWKVLDEERELMSLAEEVFVVEPRLERAGGNLTKDRGPFLDPTAFGYGPDLLHEAMVRLARGRIRRATGPEDHLRQAIGALDEILEQENALLERLREWYGLHFPELAPTVDPSSYVDLIAMHGRRERMPLPPPDSVGAVLGEPEEDQLKAFAALAKSVGERRKAIEGYVEHSVRELAPNVAELTGPMIAARLVSLAGGVEKLARAPAGTVQLLGAERALFRHLRSGSRPPKHGVLFQHPWVHRSPRWQRGAVARAFAGRISIAARADAYTKRRIASDLLKDLEGAIAEIRRRKAERPARPRYHEAPKKRARREKRRQ